MAGDERSEDVKGSAAKKVLVPMAASAASAATSYAIKKAPDVYRQKVAPKLEQKGGLQELVQDLLERLKGVAGAVTPDELPFGLGNGDSGGQARRSPRTGSAPPAELERNRRGREARRRKRRQSLSR
jgi:hypothetical protein